MKILIFDVVVIASGMVVTCFSVFITFWLMPYLRKSARHSAELTAMAKRTLVQNTGAMIFGKFKKQVQSEFLGKFLTSLFGDILFEIITEWNKSHATAIVTPDDEAAAGHMRYLAMAEASSLVLQSHGLGRYFRGAMLHGEPEYRFCRLFVAIACPKADHLTSHEHPRLIIIEEGALMRIADEETIPQWDNQDGNTWLTVLKELAEKWRSGEQNGIAVLEIPVDEGPMNVEVAA